jgi:PA domain
VVRTPFGVYKEPKMVQVVVDGINQDGSTAGGGSFVDLWNLDTDETVEGRFGGKGGAGPATLSVPVGTYSLMAFLWTLDAAGVFGREVTMASRPEITLTEDTHIVLDGRNGQLLNPITPEPTESRELTLSYHRATAKHSYDMHYLMDRYVDAAYVTQTEPVTRGEFEVNSHWELYAPEFTMRLAGSDSTIDAEYTEGSPRIDGRKTFELVDVGRGTPEDVAGRDLTGRLALIEQSDDIAIADQVEAVSDAGAAAAIVYYSRPGFLLGSVPDGSPIPSFTMEQAPGQALVAKARTGQTRVEITGTPESPYVYDLFPYYTGGVPASIDRRVDQRSLSRVTANYYGSGSQQHGLEVNFPSRPHDSFVLRQAQPVAIPTTRTEWVSPGDIVWQPVTYQTLDREGALVGSERSYRAGQRSVEDWFGPVVRPGVPAVGDADDAQYGLPGFRTGDEFTIQIRSMLDSGDHHSEGGGSPRSRLYRDGQLVAERDSLEGTWPASAQPAQYRLELDVQQSTPWWQHATSTHTAWGFSSSRPPAGEHAYLDLLQIDYDVATDLNGQVSANRATEVGLRVYPQTHPDELVPVSLQVWVSYDAGGTWQPAGKVKQATDGSFSASVKHPKGAESVSLRVKATGPHGSSIDQTVIRAFSCAG